MNNLTFFQSILIWAGGFDSKTAAQCTSSEIKKMTIAGTLVLIPAFLALFSYSYAFYIIFGNKNAAIAGGIIAAMVLFVIDRSIMAYGRPGVFSLGMAGRVFLAVTIGFLLAEPLILKIFEDSIIEQQFKKVNDAKISNAVDYDLKIKEIQDKIDEGEKRLYDLQNDYTAEMDGTGGSRIRNQGPIFMKKYNDYLDFRNDFNSTKANLESQISMIQNDKVASLQMVEATNANGIIGRMRALSALGETEPIVKWTTWLLRIFFTLIELIPVFIKISPSGDRGLYYWLVDKNDEELQQIVDMSAQERLHLKEQEEKLRLTHATAELNHKEIQVLANSKEKETEFLMSKAYNAVDRKLNFDYQAHSTINQEQLLTQLLEKFDHIHDGYMQSINQLILKSNSNFSKNS